MGRPGVLVHILVQLPSPLNKAVYPAEASAAMMISFRCNFEKSRWLLASRMLSLQTVTGPASLNTACLVAAAAAAAAASTRLYKPGPLP